MINHWISCFNPFVNASFVKQAFASGYIWQFGDINLGSWVLLTRRVFQVLFQYTCTLLVLVYILSLDYTLVLLPIQ